MRTKYKSQLKTQQQALQNIYSNKNRRNNITTKNKKQLILKQLQSRHHNTITVDMKPELQISLTFASFEKR